ncbi:uncharacterized protein LOC144365023 [Ictidomys tridecemlineatus]
MTGQGGMLEIQRLRRQRWDRGSVVSRTWPSPRVPTAEGVESYRTSERPRGALVCGGCGPPPLGFGTQGPRPWRPGHALLVLGEQLGQLASGALQDQRKGLSDLEQLDLDGSSPGLPLCWEWSHGV